MKETPAAAKTQPEMIVFDATASFCAVKTSWSTHIPIGEKHRLKNPGTIPLEIIKVQSGSYLGGDDIVRFEDVYNRHR